MKLALSLSLSFFALFTLNDKSYSLTNYQITQICKKENRRSTCKNNLLEKKHNLQKGKLIEVPVKPYKQ